MRADVDIKKIKTQKNTYRGDSNKVDIPDIHLLCSNEHPPYSEESYRTERKLPVVRALRVII